MASIVVDASDAKMQIKKDSVKGSDCRLLEINMIDDRIVFHFHDLASIQAFRGLLEIALTSPIERDIK